MNGTEAVRSATPLAAASILKMISFPPLVYETLEEKAKLKKISLPWVFRDAAEQYIAGKRPLVGKRA